MPWRYVHFLGWSSEAPSVLQSWRSLSSWGPARIQGERITHIRYWWHLPQFLLGKATVPEWYNCRFACGWFLLHLRHVSRDVAGSSPPVKAKVLCCETGKRRHYTGILLNMECWCKVGPEIRRGVCRPRRQNSYLPVSMSFPFQTRGRIAFSYSFEIEQGWMISSGRWILKQSSGYLCVRVPCPSGRDRVACGAARDGGVTLPESLACYGEDRPPIWPFGRPYLSKKETLFE